jgi:peroxiredoxin
MFIMPPLKTPICDFGTNAKDFQLNSTINKLVSLNDMKGENGTLIMFICNHCPYVKAVIKDVVEDCKNLEKIGINAIAISSNDAVNYPEDSFENMIEFSKEHNFTFPYLFDETQNVAKSYNAVCTPDFFGYNGNLELQYRGRIRELKDLKPIKIDESDLFKAMKQISETGKGPKKQIPSLGCSIKWLDNQCI